jgi:hypothetical protein
MRRSEHWALLGFAAITMVAAIVVLVPSGVSRIGMILGSVLVLLHHGAHMLWILRPVGGPSWADLGLAFGAASIWIAVFSAIMRSRPTYAEDAAEEP